MLENTDLTKLSKMIALCGAIVVSVATILTFDVALLIAYLSKDQNNLSLLIGAVISNASTAVMFWLGSSFSSHRKDEMQNLLAPYMATIAANTNPNNSNNDGTANQPS